MSSHQHKPTSTQSNLRIPPEYFRDIYHRYNNSRRDNCRDLKIPGFPLVGIAEKLNANIISTQVITVRMVSRGDFNDYNNT
jgi:hypothetical protein